MPTINRDAVGDTELWDIIMRIADPADLLRTILNQATARAECSGGGASPLLSQTLILTGCEVTIHQHLAQPPSAAPS